MRYSPKREDDKWLEYDKTRFKHQNATISDLQAKIQEYNNRERSFLVHLHLKDKQISVLNRNIKDLKKKKNEDVFKTSEDYLIDPLLHSEFNVLKATLKEKEEKIWQKEEELNNFRTNTVNHQFKKLVTKCRELNKENLELYNYTQAGTLENLKYENGLEKSQIDQLMIKLKEKELLTEDYEFQLNDITEALTYLTKKVKELEDKENKSKSKHRDS